MTRTRHHPTGIKVVQNIASMSMIKGMMVMRIVNQVDVAQRQMSVVAVKMAGSEVPMEYCSMTRGWTISVSPTMEELKMETYQRRQKMISLRKRVTTTTIVTTSDTRHSPAHDRLVSMSDYPPPNLSVVCEKAGASTARKLVIEVVIVIENTLTQRPIHRKCTTIRIVSLEET